MEKRFKIKIPVQSLDDEVRGTYRDDAIVISVQAADESTAVSIVAEALTKLCTRKVIGDRRVFETI